MTPEFILPRSFQPAEFLPGRLGLRADDARWLVSTILKKTAAKDVDLWGLVRLHSDILRRVMDTRSSADVVRRLVAGGAVEEASYQAGVKAKGFRLASRWLGDRCVRLRATDPRLIERIQRERDRQSEQERKARWKPIHYQLADEQRHVTITDEADAILDALPDHTRLCQSVLVSNIRRRTMPFSVSSTGRCFNAITGLKRELRGVLRIEGKPVASVDIVAAQPSLLAFLLGQIYPPSVPKSRTTYKHTLCPSPPLVPWSPAPVPPLLPPACPCAPAFASSVFGGVFYETLAADCGLTREETKLRFLVDVMAKKGRYPSAVESAFRRRFPGVYQFIKAINADDHGALIRLLQQAESGLVVETVSPQLLSRRIRHQTLHDAVYSQAERLDDVEGTFSDVLAELGVNLKLKRE